MTTAWVAGATGFTGRETVRALRAAGAGVVAHVRPDSPRLDEWRRRLGEMGAEVDATAWQPDALRGALAAARPDLVFALLGTTRARMKQARARGEDAEAQSYRAVDYGLTRLLLRACLDAGQRPCFVYLSAAGVGADAKSAYARTRWEMEEEVRKSGLDYVIARPSFIVGERDESRPGEKWGSLVIDGLLGAVGAAGARKLRDRYRSTSNTALAGALVRLALDPATESRVYESEELR